MEVGHDVQVKQVARPDRLRERRQLDLGNRLLKSFDRFPDLGLELVLVNRTLYPLGRDLALALYSVDTPRTANPSGTVLVMSCCGDQPCLAALRRTAAIAR